ncbi:MAG: dihydropteridine reductase [Clostridia bacterium]|nr:dihydropteridine reductase [Clostridia bacterium]
MNSEKEFLVQKICTQYTEKAHTALDDLKALDTKVKRPATVFSYLFGTAGALVLGTGMSLAMGVIGSSMPLGIGVGLLGILMVAVNYPLYQRILGARRKKYAPEIIAMSDRIMNENQ